MKFKFLISAALIAVSVLLLTGCSKDETPEVVSGGGESMNVTKNIVGTWLLGSSTADEWATYEFTETSRINVKSFSDERQSEGTGYYSVDEGTATVSGSYDTGNGRSIYVDWQIVSVKPFNIDINIYDNTTLLSSNVLYRILREESVEYGTLNKLNFRDICGTAQVSNVKVIDPDIATVTENGEITGKKIGSTFVTFTSTNGTSAIVLHIVPAKLSVAELVNGTWVYDNPGEKVWERYNFSADGTVFVDWANPYSYNTIETGNGYYTLDGDNCSFSVTTPYNLQMNLTFNTKEINLFTWSYAATSDGASVGSYTAHRLLGSKTIKRGEKFIPDYSDFTFGYDVVRYTSNNTDIAIVDHDGLVRGLKVGRTYINVHTVIGAGYFEIYVE